MLHQPSPSRYTVYAGNLAYAVTEESLRHTVESQLSDGAGSVADVRIAVNKETGLKRGFAYVVRQLGLGLV